MVQSGYLPRPFTGSGRAHLLDLLGFEENGGVPRPVSAGSLGLSLVNGLYAVAERCRALADADRAWGFAWDRHLRCTYISKSWYQRVQAVASRHTGLDLRSCHRQDMFVIGGAFSLSVWWVNARRLSVRNRTRHSLGILSQLHRVEGFDPLRFWELSYEITSNGVLRDVRFQYRWGWRILDAIFLDGLAEGRYGTFGEADPVGETSGAAVPVREVSGEAADGAVGDRDIYDC